MKWCLGCERTDIEVNSTETAGDGAAAGGFQLASYSLVQLGASKAQMSSRTSAKSGTGISSDSTEALQRCCAAASSAIAADNPLGRSFGIGVVRRSKVAAMAVLSAWSSIGMALGIAHRS